MGLNKPPINPNVVTLRVKTTKTVTAGNYVYHTEYVPTTAKELLYGWIADLGAAPPIPTSDQADGVPFEDGDLGKKTADPVYIDGDLVDGKFVVKGDDAEKYILDDGELKHIE